VRVDSEPDESRNLRACCYGEKLISQDEYIECALPTIMTVNKSNRLRDLTKRYWYDRDALASFFPPSFTHPHIWWIVHT
jgi:hypothetical protein